MAGFEIDHINFITNPLPEEEVKTIVENSKKINEQRVLEEKKSIETKVEAEKKVFEDPRLATDKQAIERAFEKTEKTIAATT